MCSEGREDNNFHNVGVCVSMSGNGCRTFETMSKLSLGTQNKQGTKSVAFLALFQLLASDADSMEQIIAKTWANEINSRMKRRDVHFSLDGTRQAGSTVYIGAVSSDFRVSIYDKALEQGVEGHWVRVEMVMRGKNSKSFVDHMTRTDNVGKLAAQVMNDKLSFIERDDSNITRCSVCSWWQNFVEELESVRLVAREVIQHRVEQIDNWIEYQEGPSLAILFRTMGWPHIFELAIEAGRRLSDKQQSLISDYNSLQSALA